jgi:hypothetical protein
MCRWVLLATLMWPSVLLLRAMAAQALVLLSHCASASEDLKYDVKFVMPA